MLVQMFTQVHNNLKNRSKKYYERGMVYIILPHSTTVLQELGCTRKEWWHNRYIAQHTFFLYNVTSTNYILNPPSLIIVVWGYDLPIRLNNILNSKQQITTSLLPIFTVYYDVLSLNVVVCVFICDTYMSSYFPFTSYQVTLYEDTHIHHYLKRSFDVVMP